MKQKNVLLLLVISEVSGCRFVWIFDYDTMRFGELTSTYHAAFMISRILVSGQRYILSFNLKIFNQVLISARLVM